MRATVAATVLAVAAAASLGGCAPLLRAASETSPADSARQTVEQVLHGVAYDRNNDIFFAARAVDATIATTSVQLIGIDEVAGGALGDRFGTLELMLPEADYVDNSGVSRKAGPFCFRVGFNYYGAEVDGDVVATDEFDCPENAAAITPPPDETVYPVIPENARAAVHEVLTQIAQGGESPSTGEIAARIRDLLTPPTSELQSLAEPQVVDDAGRIGVAMQDADDCLLVSLVDDAVADVYPPAVLLQPGELGCSPSTAIADADQLQSPH